MTHQSAKDAGALRARSTQKTIPIPLPNKMATRGIT
jgi:hypothetical protein